MNTPKPQPTRSVPKVTAPKAPGPVARPVAGRGWRVQLGAFSEDGKAKAQWGQIKGRISSFGSLQPYLVKAANVTRLQAGPLASRADAERVCKSAQAAGLGCFPVAP